MTQFASEYDRLIACAWWNEAEADRAFTVDDKRRGYRLQEQAADLFIQAAKIEREQINAIFFRMRDRS